MGSARSRARWSSTRQGQAQRFKTLAELAAATGQETHGVELDYDIFENLHAADRRPNSSQPGKPYEAADLNFKLKAGSKAVDAGVRIPNVNDGFAGRAPDLGALRTGAARSRVRSARTDGDAGRSTGDPKFTTKGTKATKRLFVRFVFFVVRGLVSARTRRSRAFRET